MKGTPSLIVKQIKEEENTRKAIGYLADLIVESDAERCGDNEEIKTKIEELSKHIRGNGNPEKGLLSRFSKLEDRVQLLLWVGSAVTLIVVGWLLNSILGLL